jgi:hypothetical protein
MNLPCRVAANASEHRASLPGDDLIPHAVQTVTHAVTVNGDCRTVWPWLIQMGADRAGWYSYDWLDNDGRRSAEKVVPELQHPSVGAVFPALPGESHGFVLVGKETNHWLVLGWPSEKQGYVVTWAFVLTPISQNRTRLVVRARASEAYRLCGLPQAIGLWLARFVHFVMQRKQLLGIARRAERLAS